MSYREERSRLVQMPAYELAHDQKADLYAKMLTAGTQYYREKCPEYGRFLRALGCPAGSPRPPQGGKCISLAVS